MREIVNEDSACSKDILIREHSTPLLNAISSRLSAVSLLLFTITSGFAQTLPGDLKRLSREELMDIDVSSVERTEISLSDTPAAVTVLTAEDIRSRFLSKFVSTATSGTHTFRFAGSADAESKA